MWGRQHIQQYRHPTDLIDIKKIIYSPYSSRLCTVSSLKSRKPVIRPRQGFGGDRRFIRYVQFPHSSQLLQVPEGPRRDREKVRTEFPVHLAISLTWIIQKAKLGGIRKYCTATTDPAV